jgi:hypothetical protein
MDGMRVVVEKEREDGALGTRRNRRTETEAAAACGAGGGGAHGFFRSASAWLF